MSKEKKLIPELRFPEFEKDGEWVKKNLGKIAENLDSKRVPITSNERERGEIPYYGASGVIDYVKDYLFDEDLLLISEDGANLIARTYPIAFSVSGKTWVNNHAHVLKFENWFTQVLVENHLNFKNIEDFLTGMAQPKLNRGKLDIIPIHLPKNPKEQQKIASCLSSLDELISAHTDKLQALKDHKKGLMQNLFPQEGEKVSRYRFREFEKDGEWELPRLQDKMEIFRGASPRPKGDPMYYGGDIPRLMIEDVTRDGKYSTPKIDFLTKEGAAKSRLLKKGSVVLSCSGTRVAIPGILDVDACIHDGWLGFRNLKEVDTEFLYYHFCNLHIRIQKDALAGGVFNNLTTTILKELRLAFPILKEQQRIASCLSTLDELITAQAEKIKQLQLHKKGLMQGLFPKIDE